jgi:hypothetical protein
VFKKNIFFMLTLISLVGFFSQYNRTDGFLHLMKNVNAFSFDRRPEAASDKVFAPAFFDAQDHFLIIYEGTTVRTVFTKDKVAEMLKLHKKKFDAVEVSHLQEIAGEYSAVLLTVENLDKIGDTNILRTYVEQGGNVIFLSRPYNGHNLNDLAADLGIYDFGVEKGTFGIRLLTDILFAGKGREVSNKFFLTDSIALQLDFGVEPKPKIHIESYEKVPLLWEKSYGKGKFVFYNGADIANKSKIGVLTALLAMGSEAYLYPVIGARLLFIDDFPSPVPPGIFEKIYKEFQLTTAQFYRLVWWPEMLGHAERYGYKYTGLIIEDYNDRVEPPFTPLDEKTRINLITYGRELLKSGGELGVHGYNHQSLAPAGYGQDVLGYNIWPSKENMVLSLKELRRYVKTAYPQYVLRAYVPPSNILSKEGREAVMEAFPEMKVFSSLYTGVYDEVISYFQDYERHADGTYDIPRVTSGFTMDDSMWWECVSVINAKGIFSHFVHPDELFYESRKHLKWKDMSRGFKNIVETIADKYGWLRAATASETTAFMDDYFDAQFDTLLEGDTFTIHAGNGQALKAYYVLRSKRAIKSFTGCSVKKIGESAYLVNLAEPAAAIRFEGRAGK